MENNFKFVMIFIPVLTSGKPANEREQQRFVEDPNS